MLSSRERSLGRQAQRHLPPQPRAIPLGLRRRGKGRPRWVSSQGYRPGQVSSQGYRPGHLGLMALWTVLARGQGFWVQSGSPALCPTCPQPDPGLGIEIEMQMSFPPGFSGLPPPSNSSFHKVPGPRSARPLVQAHLSSYPAPPKLPGPRHRPIPPPTQAPKAPGLSKVLSRGVTLTLSTKALSQSWVGVGGPGGGVILVSTCDRLSHPRDAG